MLKAPLVSVVIASYNGEKYIREQIQSILAQTYIHLEVIVVDDKSTDDTVGIVRKFAKDDSRIKVFENKHNLGILGNFLKGLSYAQGELICFCDQDDYWMEAKVESLKALMDKSKDNMLAYSDMEICDEGLRVIHSSFWEASGIMPRHGHIGSISFLRNIMPGCSMMFRREIANLIKDKREMLPLMHDHLIFVLSSLLGNIVYVNKKLVKYRQHDKNSIGAFYVSSVDNHSIAKKLNEAVKYFNTNINKIRGFDTKTIEGFCSCLRSSDVSERLSYIRYYLFLRRDNICDKMLGLMECIMPRTYSWVRKKKSFFFLKTSNLKIFCTWVKRTVFMSWVFIVLFYFSKEFIVYKLVKFLRYIR